MNVIGLMIGKKNSMGVPGKNTAEVLGHRLCEYPLMAAKNSQHVSQIFVSTNCPIIESVSKTCGAEIIHRLPIHDAPETLTEDVLSHAHKVIKDQYRIKFDYYVLLYANGGFVNSSLIDQAILKLDLNPSFDSCVGAVNADMFTPIRAKKISKEGELLPFVDLNTFGEITSNRDSAGKVYFIDLSLQVIRPHCFDTMNGNQKPFLWLGKKILPFEKDFGGDLDEVWQFPVLEAWLLKNVK